MKKYTQKNLEPFFYLIPLILLLILVLMSGCGRPEVEEGIYSADIEYIKDNQFLSAKGWKTTQKYSLRRVGDGWSLKLVGGTASLYGNFSDKTGDENIIVFERDRDLHYVILRLHPYQPNRWVAWGRSEKYVENYDWIHVEEVHIEAVKQ